MSALKWHLCERLWELKSPIRIVTVPTASTKDEADWPDDERAVAVSDDNEQTQRKPEPLRTLRIVAL